MHITKVLATIGLLSVAVVEAAPGWGILQGWKREAKPEARELGFGGGIAKREAEAVVQVRSAPLSTGTGAVLQGGRGTPGYKREAEAEAQTGKPTPTGAGGFRGNPGKREADAVVQARSVAPSPTGTGAVLQGGRGTPGYKREAGAESG